jgi:hypothetical protein
MRWIFVAANKPAFQNQATYHRTTVSCTPTPASCL